LEAQEYLFFGPKHLNPKFEIPNGAQ
jgi:hypothetical protein